jgi:hypothetical protein
MQILRRFTWLHTNCLLSLQAELLELENELLEIDKIDKDEHCSSAQANDAKSKHIPAKSSKDNNDMNEHEMQQPSKDRKELISKIHTKLLEFGTLTEQQHRMLNYHNPAKNSYLSLRNWLWNLHSPVNKKLPPEYNWAFWEGDLMTLDPEEVQSQLRIVIDDVLTILPMWLFKCLFVSCVLSQGKRDKLIYANNNNPPNQLTNPVDRLKFKEGKYISNDRERVIVTLAFAIFTLVFLFIPIGLLYFHVQDWSKWRQLGNVIGWSAAFYIWLWFATTAKPHEALGTAAS